MVLEVERRDEVADMVDKIGVDATAEKMGLKRETVRRYVRRARNGDGNPVDLNQSELAQFRQFTERFTPEERRLILQGSTVRKDSRETVVSFASDQVTIGFFTDPHWGAKHSPRHYWDSFLSECARVDVDLIISAGDIIEGMSNRPDQMYQLTHIGWSAQMDYAEELLNESDWQIHMIDGNHDRWGIKSGGLFVGTELERRCDHVKFIGHDTGVVNINGSTWMAMHGEDGGGSYAVSYRPQKIVEAFTGGEKPNVLLLGHDHKQNYIFTRNVHTVSGGALCRQSSWMKATRKANADGFHIIKAGIESGQVVWFEPRFYPFY